MAVTLALGTAAPLASVMAPLRLAVDCAIRGVTRAQRISAENRTRIPKFGRDKLSATARIRLFLLESNRLDQMKVTTLNRFRGLPEEQRRGTSTVSLELILEVRPHPFKNTQPRVAGGNPSTRSRKNSSLGEHSKYQ